MSDDEKALSTVEQFELTGELELVPDFGIRHLTIKQAAELVVLDMWYSGEMPDVEEPENWDGNEHDPRLKALLENYAEIFEMRLLAAIDCGKLKSASSLRDFDEHLLPRKTYIEGDVLYDWLNGRGYSRGDILADWEKNEEELYADIAEEVEYLRITRKIGKTDTAFPHKPDEAYFKSLFIENQHLKEQLSHSQVKQPANVDRRLPTRQRRTLLTIIAALCGHAGINPQIRGAAQRIKEMTESQGTPIDDETIKKLLSEIPDALETRMK